MWRCDDDLIRDSSIDPDDAWVKLAGKPDSAHEQKSCFAQMSGAVDLSHKNES